MLRMFSNKKGQGVSGEYVFMIALVSLAIVAMITYMRRTLQARYRDGTAEIYMRASGALGTPVQPEYEPYYVNTAALMDSGMVDERTTDANGDIDKVNVTKRKITSKSIQKPF